MQGIESSESSVTHGKSDRSALGVASTADGASASTSSGELACGSSTGRFRIVEVLGRGAMGVVYRAYDPKLGRQIALKVPHADHRDGPAPQGETDLPSNTLPTMRARFVKEARGLAQLSHPNVVQVFSVERFTTVPGLNQGACGIAMEVVEGLPLDRWLDRPRRWRDVVTVFTEAGRGLASAHAAGLVHRDFKPSNVVFGDDGRVRVMDFGLVTAHRADEGEPNALRTVDCDVDSTLTQTGTTLGTPAYMAPEQHLGRPSDPRSDQFAFCVALFEALFGVRPFAGMSCDSLAANKQLGRRRPIPEGHDVPAHIVAAVLRGLSPTPRQRFSDMHALLGALNPPRVVRPVLRSFVAAVGLVAVGLTGGFLLPAKTTDGVSRTAAAVSAGVAVRAHGSSSAKDRHTRSVSSSSGK